METPGLPETEQLQVVGAEHGRQPRYGSPQGLGASALGSGWWLDCKQRDLGEKGSG